MKYFKLFLTVCAMAVAISASAQSKTTAKSKTATSTTKTTTAAPAKKAATTTKKTATTTAKSTSSAKSTAKTATTSSPKTTTTTTTKAAKETKKEVKETRSSSSNVSTSSSDFDRRIHFISETKVGGYYCGCGAWGENFVLEKKFHKYIAVDFFSIDFAMPFKYNNHYNFCLGLKTGARGFSPSWWQDRMCAYGSLALGYDCNIGTGVASGAAHGFGLSCGAGVQFVDRVYVGYTMEYSTIFRGTAHYGKIGVVF